MPFPAVAAIADKVVGGVEKVANAAFQVHAYNKNIELANTAHQREVRDLLAAGLNPILSAGGTGAQTPAGLPTMFDGTNDQGFSKVATAKESLRQLKVTNDNTEVDTNKKISEQEVNDAVRAKTDTEQRIQQKELENKDTQIKQQIELLNQQIQSQKSSAALNSALTAKAEEEKKAVRYENNYKGATAELYKGKRGKVLRTIDYISDKIRGRK